MKLAQAFQFPKLLRAAFVGAGGKTTALFQLAAQLPPPVLVTTTTHFGIDQTRLADHHIILEPRENVDFLERLQLLDGVVLLTGPSSNHRFGSISLEQLGRLKSYADENARPLLIEADGSRQLPIKAPAIHEPVIPAWCNVVVVVAGLSGLGRPICSETVHRMVEFNALTRASESEEITPSLLSMVLKHPQGSLKSIPPGAQKICLLNQADTDILAAQGVSIALEVLPFYDRVLIASLKNREVKACYQDVAAIILAAGGSSRFGQPKQLLHWRGKSFIRHAAMRALEAGLSPLVVVLGAFGEEVKAEIDDLPHRFVYNPRWNEGQSTSIHAGLQALDERCGACIFMLADQPQVTARVLTSLVAEHRVTLAPIIAPLIGGQRGNPVLFDRKTFEDLLATQGDQGGRAIFSRYPIHWLEWLDEALLVDVDRPDDLARLGD